MKGRKKLSVDFFIKKPLFRKYHHFVLQYPMYVHEEDSAGRLEIKKAHTLDAHKKKSGEMHACWSLLCCWRLLFFSGKARVVGGEGGGGDKRRREEGEAKSTLSRPPYFFHAFLPVFF